MIQGKEMKTLMVFVEEETESAEEWYSDTPHPILPHQEHIIIPPSWWIPPHTP